MRMEQKETEEAGGVTEEAGGAMEEVRGATEEAEGAIPCAYIMYMKRTWFAILAELYLTLRTKINDYKKEQVTKLNPKFVFLAFWKRLAIRRSSQM